VTVAAALFLVLGFLALLAALRVPSRAGDVVSRSRQALADLRSATMDELEKEQAVQAHAKALFGSFFVITALSAVALAAPAGVVWLMAASGLVDFDAALDATLSWPVLGGATVAGLAVVWLRRKP